MSIGALGMNGATSMTYDALLVKKGSGRSTYRPYG
jgi:hypothetical protein